MGCWLIITSDSDAELAVDGCKVQATRLESPVVVYTSEDGAGWTAFLQGLAAQGLSGVSLVISHAHPGLKDAVAASLSGATWQRCRIRFARNLFSKVPKSS